MPKAASACASKPAICPSQSQHPTGKAFSRTQRLTHAADFQRMFASAKRSSDEYFSVLGQNNGLSFARLGLAVARKHTKTAVTRNRTKRLIRESFRQHQAELSGLDIVVLLRRNNEKMTNRDIFQRLETLWQKIRKQCGVY